MWGHRDTNSHSVRKSMATDNDEYEETKQSEPPAARQDEERRLLREAQARADAEATAIAAVPDAAAIESAAAPTSTHEATTATPLEAATPQLEAEATATAATTATATTSALDVTEAQLASCRSALRYRLKTEHLPHTDANDTESSVAQVELLFERTVQFGENQSGLLLGSVGSATRAIVLQAMRNLRYKHRAFTHVYLNGTILQNEIEAFKEITAQLTHNRAVKHPVRTCLFVCLVVRPSAGLLVACRFAC